MLSFTKSAMPQSIKSRELEGGWGERETVFEEKARVRVEGSGNGPPLPFAPFRPGLALASCSSPGPNQASSAQPRGPRGQPADRPLLRTPLATAVLLLCSR